MRFIQKASSPPACLTDWIEVQQEIGLNLQFKYFRNPEKFALLTVLVNEQFGLCGYTGKRIVNNSNETHIEHLVPQSKCRADLTASGGKVGQDLCCDLHYTNMIACLTTEGMKQYGACARGSWFQEGYVNPTDMTAINRITYTDDGRAIATDPNDKGVEEFIKILNLDYLKEERESKIRVLIPATPDPPLTPQEAQTIVEYCDTPNSGMLPEYCFAIKAVAQAFV